MLPGGDIVRAGLVDLAQGLVTPESLAVSIAAPRLEALGIEIPTPIDHPEHRLYLLMAAENADSAHGRYNALVRRMVSFARAYGCAA